MVSSGSPSAPSPEPATPALAPDTPPDGGAPSAAAPTRPRRPAGPRKTVTPAPVRTRRAPSRPKVINTLAIDIGGTGIKASVLDPQGTMEHERVRVATPYPLSP